VARLHWYRHCLRPPHRARTSPIRYQLRPCKAIIITSTLLECTFRSAPGQARQLQPGVGDFWVCLPPRQLRCCAIRITASVEAMLRICLPSIAGAGVRFSKETTRRLFRKYKRIAKNTAAGVRDNVGHNFFCSLSRRNRDESARHAPAALRISSQAVGCAHNFGEVEHSMCSEPSWVSIVASLLMRQSVMPPLIIATRFFGLENTSRLLAKQWHTHVRCCTAFKDVAVKGTVSQHHTRPQVGRHQPPPPRWV
jgi:hypothetical protein